MKYIVSAVALCVVALPAVAQNIVQQSPATFSGTDFQRTSGVISLKNPSGGLPGGVTGDLQLNNNGAFGGLTPGTGISAWLTTPNSANLRTAVPDATGTGALYFANGALGTPISGNLAAATGYLSQNIGNLGTGVAAFLATPSSANLATAVTGETGSGALVFGTAPSISTLTLSNLTGTVQCLQVNTAGLVSGTGVACGTGGGGGVPGGVNTSIQINSGGTFGGILPGAGVSAFLATPVAGVPATWLQSGAAVANLGFTPPPNTRLVSTSGLLTGGGNLTADRTITMGAIAANTAVMNATAGSAAPTAVAVPNCVGGTAALQYTAGTGYSCGAITASGGSITVTDTTTPVTATTISFDPSVYDVVDSGGGTATLKPVTTVNSQTGTTYTLVAGDANKTIRLSNAGAVTLSTSATAATLGSGFSFYVECSALSGCTFDPVGAETIDAATTLALSQYQKAYIQTDGTAWRGAVLSSNDPRNAANLNSGTVAVARGGTGLASGTSGGVLAYTAAGTLASSGALTANMPVIGGGAGVAPSVGTKSGSTTQFVTTTGAQTSGRCVEIDALGNHIQSATGCAAAAGMSSADATMGWTPGVDLNGAIILGPVNSSTTVSAIRWRITAAAGGAATLMVRKITATQPCTSAGGGVAQTSATVDLNAAGPVSGTATLVGGAPNTLAAGEILCAEVTGTLTSAKGSVNVTYTR